MKRGVSEVVPEVPVFQPRVMTRPGRRDVGLQTPSHMLGGGGGGVGVGLPGNGWIVIGGMVRKLPIILEYLSVGITSVVVHSPGVPSTLHRVVNFLPSPMYQHHTLVTLPVQPSIMLKVSFNVDNPFVK